MMIIMIITFDYYYYQDSLLYFRTPSTSFIQFNRNNVRSCDVNGEDQDQELLSHSVSLLSITQQWPLAQAARVGQVRGL